MFEGIAIYNLLRAHPAKVTVEVLGWAASAASIIAMAGDGIRMGLGSFMMVHNAWGMVIGNRHDMREAAILFEQFDAAIADIYEVRTGMTRSDIEQLMDAETFMNPAQAIEYGFADGITDDADYTSGAAVSAFATVSSQILAKRRIDAALAQQGISRTERRKMFNQIAGTHDAADTASRGGENVERHLAGYTGLHQVNGWGAYNRLADAKRAGGPLMLAACWAHLRRKFYELHLSGVSAVANETVERMAELWKVEERIRGQNPEDRRAARQEQSAAIVADLWPFWEKELSRISGKSKLAEAIRYTRSRREALERFLDDGRLDIDSNAVERAIRPQAITRKNTLFAGSDGGGKTWATIATLLQTANMNDVDPFAWLTLTLQRIADGWPNSDLDQLLPVNHHDS